MEQLGFSGIAQPVDVGQRTQERFAHKLRRYGEILALGFDPETGDLAENNTAAAFLAGLSDTREKAKFMAYKYKGHRLVKQAMEEMVRQQRGHYGMAAAEYLGSLRDTFDKAVGHKPVLMPVFDQYGNPKVDQKGKPLTREMRFFKPEAAAKLLEQMGKVTGLLNAPVPESASDKADRVLVSPVALQTDEEWENG